MEEERRRKRVHTEEDELIILLVYGTLSITGLSKGPLLLSLFYVILISYSHCCPLHRQNHANGFAMYPFVCTHPYNIYIVLLGACILNLH